MGAPQSPAAATPPRAPKRGGLGAPMAHRDQRQQPPPSARPGRDFVGSLCAVNGTLECPPQEDRHPYRNLPGGFWKHLQDALFPPWIIGRGSMTAWHARIVGAEWLRKWGRWFAATRAPGAPAQQYAAIPLEGWGPHTGPRPTMIGRGGYRPPVGRSGRGMATGGASRGVEWGRVTAHLSALHPPHRPQHRQRAPSHGDTHIGTRRGHRPVAPLRGRGRLAHRGAPQKWGTCVRRRPVPAGRHSGAPAPHALFPPCSRATPGARQL